MITKERAEEIVNEKYDTVFKFCHAKPCIKEYDAEELTQDIFLLFYEKLDILQDDKIGRWLYAVAKRKCYTFYKNKKKDRELMLYFEDTYNSIYDILMVRDAYFKVTEEEIEKSVKVILDTLDEEEYVLYYKKYVEGKKHWEIAEEMGLTLSNVGVRSSRLTDKLETLAKMAFSGFGQLIIKLFF